MQYDSNGFVRYKEGDLAVVVRPETDFHENLWDSRVESILGETVHIVLEKRDSDGYYYSVKEVGFVIDIAFLRPVNTFEFYDEEEDITEANMSVFIGEFKVVN